MRRLRDSPRARAVAVIAAATGAAVLVACGVLAVSAALPAGPGGGGSETAPPGLAASEASAASGQPASGAPTAASTVAPVEPAAPAAAVLPAIDGAWLDRVAVGTGIPRVALAAYAGAALRMEREAPSCHLDWATLAAVGLVESEHGTIQGGSIRSDGVVRPPVIGIALDGTSTTAQPDSEGGALDGDADWDRAVGPMQLIPSTWQRFAADGNGDGVADPQQIADAVLTAARYLCADGHDLAVSTQWIAAISAYNVGADYNARIASATETYAAAG